MKAFYLLFVSFFLFVFSNVGAQERMIHGRVFTFDSIPVVGAEIVVKSTDMVVKTDSSGKFSVACSRTDRLKVMAKGFSTAKFKVEEKTKVVVVNLKLKPGKENREIAIGYGYVLDAEKLNAAASINEKDLNFSQYTDMYDLIQGRFAGVQISNGEIIIRGTNSINSSSAALIILDGTPVDNGILRSLPPSQVKSISIIKDGSAAIYGLRGANGVVIIESKKGND